MARGSERVGQREAPAALPLASRLALPLALPLVLFVVLRPDRVFIQNGLDPFFYTGYVQNFDDMAPIVMDRHYFVSRWTLYLPGRVTDAAFGPLGGFLTLRWLWAAVLLAAVVVLGRHRWSAATTVHLCVLTLVGPMVLRALFTDYTDTVVLPATALGLALLATRPRSLVAGAATGVLFGAALVAQPTALTVAGTATVAYLVFAPDRRRALAVLAAAAGGAAALVFAGWVWFRWRYGIDVYAPTIDFVRDNVGFVDALRSPRSLWLAYYLWDYLPAVVLAVAAVLHRRDRTRFDGAERTILLTLALQYAFQIAYQFLRKGTTLELVYYWSYVLPSFTLATAVVVGTLLRRVDERVVAGLAAAVVVVLLVAPRPFPGVPSWVVLAAVAAALGALAWRLRHRARWLPAAVLTALVVFVPLASPRPLPLLPGELHVDAAYEAAYVRDSTGGEEAFRAATWFVEAMEPLGDEVEHGAFFWMGGGWGHQLGAVYGAHVSGRRLNFPPTASGTEALGMSEATADILRAGMVGYVAVLGTDAEVDELVAWLEGEGIAVAPLLDEHAPVERQTRVLVAALSR